MRYDQDGLPVGDPRYTEILKGICPNTQQTCQKLDDLQFARRVSHDSFAMGFGNGHFDAMTSGQREAFERSQEASIRRMELSTRVIESACAGSCALASVDVGAFVSNNGNTQPAE